MNEANDQATDRQASREPVLGMAVWGVLVAVCVIYLVAFPIKIQYWVTRMINNQLYNVEDRKWMPVREVWWTFIRDAPVFGSQMLVQVVVAVSAVGAVVASLWLLRLILTDDGGQATDA